MEKILIIGDVHLGKGLALGKTNPGELNSRILDQARLLDWILEIVDEKLITTLIFTGDIFEDVKPDYRIFEIFSSFLRQCQNLNLEVHLILGNHELKRTGGKIFSPLQILAAENYENIFYHSTINTIHKEGISFTFFPFTDRRMMQAENHQKAIDQLTFLLPYQLSDAPIGNLKLLIGHLALEGSIYVGDEIDDQSNELHCPLNMFSGYDYVWMGHVHKPQVRQTNPNFVAHIGSLDLSDFGEIDHQKHIIFFDAESKKYEMIIVPSRQLRKFSCNLTSEIGDIPQYVRQEFKKLETEKSWQKSILKMEVFSAVPLSDEVRTELKKIPFEFGIFHLAYFIESCLTQNSISLNVKNESSFSLLTPQKAIDAWVSNLSLSEEQKKKISKIGTVLIEKMKDKK